MRDKPWSAVLEWLADQSGLPIITNYKPTGTFTFIAAQKSRSEYTLPEIIDILNEALLNQKYILIRRSSSITIVPADEKIDPAILPRIRPEELDERGNTELVSMVLPLSSLVAEDAAGEVKKMMGPFGEVVALSRANQLLLQDTAGNLKRIKKTIQDIEDTEKNQGESYSHPCKYVKARDAEKTLKDLLGDPRELLRALQPQPQFRDFQGGGGRAQPPLQPAPVVNQKIRMHYISADERTNTVLVRGPADVIAQAKEILKKIDVPQRDQPPVLVGPPTFRKYSVPSGNAEAMAKTLQEIYKASNSVRISAVGNGSILVYAGPEEQFEIAKHIEGSKEASGGPEVVPLNSLDASKVAETLKGMFGGDSKTGGPYLEADLSRNAIIVKGTSEQLAEVKAALKALGEGAGGSQNMRIISLDKGSAATLAEALERMLPRLRQNPVHVIVPGSESSKPELQPAEKREPATKPLKSAAEYPDAQTTLVGQQPSDPRDQPAPKEARPGNPNAPINIMAFGNRLVITSDDPQALALVQELVRLLQTPGGEGDFEVIKLKNANATDAAKVLDEAFNGTKPTQQQGIGFFGQFGGRGVAPPPNPSANRIRVVADASTNSLLVRASPLDMLTIRRLLEKAIDTSETDSKAIVRSWLVPLKHANATEVSNTIKEAYREYMNRDAFNITVGGFPGFGFGRVARTTGNPNVDANGNPRTVSLSVGVDDRSNRLILVCSERLYDDIKKLIEQLDQAAKDSTRTVKVISVKGIDPALVQQAVDAIQGRRTTRPGDNTRTGPFGTNPQFGGPQGNQMQRFGPGGFQPGGNRGGPPDGGRQGPGGQQSRGPDFFEQRVKDDPRQTLLYDPQFNGDDHVDYTGAEPGITSVSTSDERPDARDGIELTAFQQQQPSTSPGSQVQGPRLPVTAEALEQLGVIVITGNNPADVEEVVRLIEYIQRLGAGSEVQIQLVTLERADATAVANTLTLLYQRVLVSPTGNLSVSPARTPTAGAAVTAQGPFGGQAAAVAAAPAAQQAASVVLLPLPRFNAILLAAPQSRIADVVKEIKRLDKPNAPQVRPIPFALRKASAARVAALLTDFYAQRYPSETAAQHQIRVTHEDSTNTVFVQAGPADLEEIKDLITRIDSTVSSAINDVRIVYLRNSLAADLSSLLSQAISQGVAAPATPTGPTVVPAALGAARAPGAALGAVGLGGAPLGGVAPTPPAATAAGAASKSTTLRFISTRPGIKGSVESGLLEDIHITADPRVNSLILSAPATTMDLLLALIRDLDVPPQARAQVKVFNLHRADAGIMAGMLQQLFLGSGGGTGAAAPAPALGGGAIPGAGGAAATVAPVAATATSGIGIPRAQFTLGGTTPEGAPLVPLSITTDARSNSLIIAGSPNDLEVAEAIVTRLDDAKIEVRHNDVYRLRNASAADVATTLQNFLTRSLTVLQQGQQLAAFQEIEENVVVVAEPITNTLLISATPQYYADVMRLIQELDAQPLQVVIQVLIAEVDLSNTDEFGVEVGLQSPVLFSRSIIPADTLIGANGVTYTNAPGGLVPPGVTVNNSLNPAAQPGFNFNNVALPLGNNPVVGPGIVGFQGLNNLGVGRANSSGLGGFVFSAASNSFNLLIRALKTQGRLDVLSRPQIQTLDNQTALINVGQDIPYVNTSNITATGIISNSILYRPVGVILQVTPRISPDGTVIMRVIPEVSSVANTTISLGNNQTATAFNTQHVETTVFAQDGETVAIGGLITKHDERHDNKIPWLGDLPYIGALFRYRTQMKMRTELLVILTPRIVRSRFDADRILAEESRKLDWCLKDVLSIHGTTGMEPVNPPPPPQQGTGVFEGLPDPSLLPATPIPVPLKPEAVKNEPPPEKLPVPQTLPPPGSQQGGSKPP
jgi:type II secretory pathway component GspD/PulD (secretin)